MFNLRPESDWRRTINVLTTWHERLSRSKSPAITWWCVVRECEISKLARIKQSTLTMHILQSHNNNICWQSFVFGKEILRATLELRFLSEWIYCLLILYQKEKVWNDFLFYSLQPLKALSSMINHLETNNLVVTIIDQTRQVIIIWNDLNSLNNV